jgi:hypothetical protein
MYILLKMGKKTNRGNIVHYNHILILGKNKI